jgi:hypothetical protein
MWQTVWTNVLMIPTNQSEATVFVELLTLTLTGTESQTATMFASMILPNQPLESVDVELRM